MHCAICDKEDDNVTHNNTDCYECQEVIYETLAGYGQEVILSLEPELVEMNIETITE